MLVYITITPIFHSAAYRVACGTLAQQAKRLTPGQEALAAATTNKCDTRLPTRQLVALSHAIGAVRASEPCSCA